MMYINMMAVYCLGRYVVGGRGGRGGGGRDGDNHFRPCSTHPSCCFIINNILHATSYHSRELYSFYIRCKTLVILGMHREIRPSGFGSRGYPVIKIAGYPAKYASEPFTSGKSFF